MENNSKPHGRGYHKRRQKVHTLTDVRTMNAVISRPTTRTMDLLNSRPNHLRMTAPSPCQNIGKRPLTVRTVSFTRWKWIMSDDKISRLETRQQLERLCDKEVPKACSILSQFSSPLSSNSELSSQRHRPGNYLSRESGGEVHHTK